MPASNLPAAPVQRRNQPDQDQTDTLAAVVHMLDKPDRQAQLLSLLETPEAVERFRTVTIHAISSRRDLLECNQLSIVEAVREAASLRLEPSGVLGEAWLVPYKGNAKLRIGWQGYLKLIRQSGQVRAVDCQVVYMNDVFDLQLGTSPAIHHIPAQSDRGGYRGAYAWAQLLDGTFIIEWLPVEDAEPIRKIAAADSLMWREFPGEGYRKSAIRRLQKRLPKSIESNERLVHALEVEAQSEDSFPPLVTGPARARAVLALQARNRTEQAAVEEAPPAAQGQAEGAAGAAPTPEPADPELEALWEREAGSDG